MFCENIDNFFKLFKSLHHQDKQFGNTVCYLQIKKKLVSDLGFKLCNLVGFTLLKLFLIFILFHIVARYLLEIDPLLL